MITAACEERPNARNSGYVFHWQWGPPPASTDSPAQLLGGARRSERSERHDNLTNLSLRHEDQMSINRSQSNYIMFLQTKRMLTVVPEMIKGIQTWKEAREQQPGTITLPLRTCSIRNWLKLLRTWDAKEKAMKIKPDREPMTPHQILELIRQMEAMVLTPHGIMRFHATRKLSWKDAELPHYMFAKCQGTAWREAHAVQAVHEVGNRRLKAAHEFRMRSFNVRASGCAHLPFCGSLRMCDRAKEPFKGSERGTKLAKLYLQGVGRGTQLKITGLLMVKAMIETASGSDRVCNAKWHSIGSA
ncbi:unnamed protein product [Symbiodinium microadriaticum]|nr:unnamed protein product [Symbiodinium microadriaticum]